jgi:uncharacterized protein YegP (UPF0339 family)
VVATATKKVDVAASLDRASRAVPEAASLEFRIYLDEGGGYSWEIVDGGGESLARSASFASQDDSARAARCVYEGVGSARFELDAPKQRETVAA